MTLYTVVQGDTLSKIAKRHGLATWQQIYHHPNNAEIRRIRSNPDLLVPGDHFFVPTPNSKVLQLATGESHRFVVRRLEHSVDVRLRDPSSNDFSGCSYKMKGGRIEFDGVVNGMISHRFPVEVNEVELQIETVQDGQAQTLIWCLRVGELDPIEQVTGYQARLNSLGYDCGRIDGIVGPRTQRAVRAFQRDAKITIDGIVGPQTRAALLEHYGC